MTSAIIQKEDVIIGGVRYHHHLNGSGLVAETANVALTVHVGAMAVVSGNARLEGEVRLTGSVNIGGDVTASGKIAFGGSGKLTSGNYHSEHRQIVWVERTE